jgi:hypothetical protein
LSEGSTADQLLGAYEVAERDAVLAEANRKAIKDLLTKEHKFKLTEEDLQTMDHVFDVFALYGTGLNYSSNIGGGQGGRGGGANTVSYGELMVLSENGMNRSYLASEESFRFMKDMERKNLLIPVVGNFGGPKAIRAVGQYLKDHGTTVGAFYLSNVEQYLFSPPRQGGNTTPIHREFYENVGTLPLDESSTFIRSGNQGGGGGRGGGLTPMMSSMMHVLREFKEGRINSQQDLLNLSTR